MSSEESIALLENVLQEIHVRGGGGIDGPTACELYSLEEPYTYCEAVAAALLKLHEGETDQLNPLAEEEMEFRTPDDRIAFVNWGRQLSQSTYRTVVYPHNKVSPRSLACKIYAHAP